MQQQVASTQQTPQHFLGSLSRNVVRGCCLFLFYFYFSCFFFIVDSLCIYYGLHFDVIDCVQIYAYLSLYVFLKIFLCFPLPLFILSYSGLFVFLKTPVSVLIREKKKEIGFGYMGEVSGIWEKFKEGKPYSKYIVLKKILILF